MGIHVRSSYAPGLGKLLEGIALGILMLDPLNWRMEKKYYVIRLTIDGINEDELMKFSSKNSKKISKKFRFLFIKK